MSVSFKDLTNTPTGRTAIISLLLALLMFFFSWLIVLSNPSEEVWYFFIYNVENEGDFNWWIVIIESILFTLLYLFLVIFMGNLAELNNQIPTWKEVFYSAAITLITAIFIPKSKVGVFELSDDIGQDSLQTGEIYQNTTETMQWVIVLFAAIGIVLMTLYLMYTEPKE
ncbi:MAG: hypothetical protein OEZ01_11720 [Candidatus Heimdallarchaeota archaeon]|nr:hypothetical protein [Candidatus Heimdallarchaeota archaeon]MDH5646671.1 hypothetical protein [Candidatus Heimdallarchaeota archaeon]